MRIGVDLLSEKGTPGGIHTYANELLAELLKLAEERPHLGLEFVVFAHRDYSFSFPVADSSRARVVLSPWRGLAAGPRRIYDELALPGLARHHRVDLVHCVNNVLPSRIPVPGVLTVHDLSPFAAPARFGRWKHRYLTRRVPDSILRAAQVIAVSSATRADILTWVPAAEPEKVHVIHEAAAGRFSPERSPGDEEAIRRQYGLPERYVLHVSLVEPGKNLDAVSRALHRLKEAGTVAPLVVAGAATDYLNRLRELWDELRIAAQILYLESVPARALPHLYRMATALVFPSRHEGFGLPVLEAFACGTPVIASTRSSLPEIAGEAALLVPAERPEVLAENLRRVWLDPGLRRLLRERGLRRARDFSWRRCAEETSRVYRACDSLRDAPDATSDASPLAQNKRVSHETRAF